MSNQSEAEKQEPVGEAYLCDDCSTPFDGAFQCPSCGCGRATKEPVYTSPPQRQPLTDEQIDFLNFLYGAGEWDGVWFEGKHPTKRGAFWWRKDMKRLFDYNSKEKL